MSNDADIAIELSELGKRYLVSPKSHADLRTLDRMKMRFLETFPGAASSGSDYWFWPLRDINLKVSKGQSIGIIGGNGSGKSTLLKLIAGVTLPSEGSIRVRGSIGALLEVGTGFHPDLTGRDNVFMSGALLGISKKVIRYKFDEIVAFSGLEKFIDTPVKRYSSGMYVRLAFATASLLRADIMILDEVMAVGDAEFRERSEASLEDASASGTTTFFVSHNMDAIRRICSRVLFLQKGALIFDGDPDEAISHYMSSIHLTGDRGSDSYSPIPSSLELESSDRHDATLAAWESDSGEDRVLRAMTVSASATTPSGSLIVGSNLTFEFELFSTKRSECYLSMFFHDLDGNRIFVSYSTHQRVLFEIDGSSRISVTFPNFPLSPKIYSVMIDFGEVREGHFQSIDCIKDVLRFKTESGSDYGPPELLMNQGYIMQRASWKVSGSGLLSSF